MSGLEERGDADGDHDLAQASQLAAREAPARDALLERRSVDAREREVMVDGLRVG